MVEVCPFPHYLRGLYICTFVLVLFFKKFKKKEKKEKKEKGLLS